MRIEAARLALLCAFATASGWAQEIQLGRAYLEFDYHFKPASPTRTLWVDATAELAGGRVIIHRTLSDRANQVYFGYDMVLDGNKLSAPYRVSFRPLTTRAQDLVIGQDGERPVRPTAWTYRPPRDLPAAMALPPGVEFEMDLSPKAQNGPALMDSVVVEGRFYLMALSSAQRPKANLSMTKPVRGQLFWFYVPGKGRYILSMEPRADLGFREAGTVQHSDCTFGLDGENYRLEFQEGFQDDWTSRPLYVLRDAEYVPAASSETERIITGTVSAAELAQFLK